MYSRLLAGMIAVMSIGGMSGLTNAQKKTESFSGDKSTRIIVEVNESLEGLSKSEIMSTQDNVIKAIKRNVTSNFDVVNRYSVLNNAFVLDVNKDAVSAIEALPGVASVTYDKIHAKRDLPAEDRYSVTIQRGRKAGEDEGSLEPNISAQTMYKPESGTAEGEGTVIAILDNEFYLRGQTSEDPASPWNHAVFKPLPEGTFERYTFDSLTATLKNTNAKRKDGATAGQEGSLYFNNKVPFYYDYGGESEDYGKVGPEDYDVSSLKTYHGSHVATIAAGNADTYKGIAPKAQLACMKVFTTYIAPKTGEAMGFGTSTGAYDTAILKALEDAITLGVDGINMSLGSDLGDFDENTITMKTLAKLAKTSGIMTAISAGNAGKTSYSFTGGYGNWTTNMVETGVLGSYANSTEATIIASGQPTRVYFENAIKIGEKNIAYEDQIVNREGFDKDYPDDNQHWLVELREQIGENVKWCLVPGFGTSSDYKDIKLLVKDAVAVVNRGSISFADKYNIAVSNGAIGVIIINNDPTANDFNFRCSFGDNFSPTVPCALVLYKDKVIFENAGGSGTFSFISKEVSDNDLARTISTFSSDGARWNYELKPDVTAPGDNIRGAVPPQKKEHREDTPYSTYEYLSGTSMSAPNYAGAQSLVLSKEVEKHIGDGTISAAEKRAIKAFRQTVDMRLMSTADPMNDSKANPENGAVNYTSPRLQGAGMVNLGKAYETDVYLEGLSLKGSAIGKSKICLYNNEDIANGRLNLSVLAHNEGENAQTYTAKVTVMRPAIEENNKVIPDKYHYSGEIDSIEKIAGLTYYVKQINPQTWDPEDLIIVKKVNPANASKDDVIKLTKQIPIYDTPEMLEADTPRLMEPGYYKNTSSEGCVWEPLEGFEYQSVQDVVVAEFTRENIEIPTGDNKIKLVENWEIPAAEKEKILEKFEYGCAIEGYVELIQSNERKLSVPFLGFYSGADLKDGQLLKDAPVVEPFSFEKDPSKVYPSDLLNDVARQLVGKDNAEFGSTWTVGYAKATNLVDTEKVLYNDTSFEKMLGWHKVGTNPETEEYYDNPQDNIYVGNPYSTNTMIIQQYVMRSVSDNFFTIKNADGEVVYKSILEDMLFGDGGQLHKSHVAPSYLGSGIIAHKAYAVIPLYDASTNKAFESGTYELEFNYKLQCDGSWVSKAYNFTIDTEAPEVTDIKEYEENGVKRLRIELAEQKVAYASLGYGVVDVHFDSEKGCYYIDETVEEINNIMDQLGTLSSGQKRLTLSVTDAAYGTSGAIIHFFGSTMNNYVIAQGPGLETNQDFVKDGSNILWYTLNYGGTETPFTQEGYVTVYTHIEVPGDAVHDHVDANADNFCDICGKDLTEKPVEPEEPDDPEQPKDEGEGEKNNLNFFQRLGQWFKDLFKKIADFFAGLFLKNK